MQIISGIYKNRPLKSPMNEKTHPMGSREKLALFNMLMPYLEDSTVLDAYAGSGALGLEALSRGARFVTFVESSGKVAKTIKENIKSLDETAEENSEIIVREIAKFQPETDYGLIIADPPYNNFHPEEIESLASFLKPSGILALSHPGDAPTFSGLTLQKSHSYAAATISIYKKS